MGCCRCAGPQGGLGGELGKEGGGPGEEWAGVQGGEERDLSSFLFFYFANSFEIQIKSFWNQVNFVILFKVFPISELTFELVFSKFYNLFTYFTNSAKSGRI